MMESSRDDRNRNRTDDQIFFLRLFTDLKNMDVQQIKYNLDIFSIAYLPTENIEKLRFRLKKHLVTEILKTDVQNRQFYEECLRESNRYLCSPTEYGYHCVFVGCSFKGDRHKTFLKHIRRCHPTIRDIMCNFRKSCKRYFSSFQELLDHVKSEHYTPNVEAAELPRAIDSSSNVSLEISCKCDRLSCGGFKYRNLNELMTHYNSFHVKELRPCIFEGCKNLFKPGKRTSALNHFKRHRENGQLKLKAQYLLSRTVPSIITPDLETCSSVDQISEEDSGPFDVTVSDSYQMKDIEDIEVSDHENESYNEAEIEEDQHFYRQYYAHHLNHLAYGKFVPQSTIQGIVDEDISSTKKLIQRQVKVVKDSLKHTNLTNEKISEVVNRLENDTFLEAQISLNTKFKRKRAIQECDNYVEAIEILLNPDEVKLGHKKDVYHYVPIDQSIKCLVQDKSFLQMRSKSDTQNTNGKLRDLKDGSHYKRNNFFCENPDAYSIILYSDAVEIKNPLGAAKGSYKVVQVYYTLAEVEKSQRSQIDRLQLVMVFREKLLKRYSLKTILKPLIQDLESLETDGVEVSVPDIRTVKCGLLCYIADNLEASIVGGFSANFSSRDICRICHAQYESLENDTGGRFDFWTEAEYNAICASLNRDTLETDSDEDLDSSCDDISDQSSSDNNDVVTHSSVEIPNKRGIRSECPFNVLRSFHSVTGFPLDFMHDVLEGKRKYSI